MYVTKYMIPPQAAASFAFEKKVLIRKQNMVVATAERRRNMKLDPRGRARAGGLAHTGTAEAETVAVGPVARHGQRQRRAASHSDVRTIIL